MLGDAHEAPQRLGWNQPVWPRASLTLRLPLALPPWRPRNSATKQAVAEWQLRAAPISNL